MSQLLHKVDTQQTEGLFTYSVVVADNDGEESARPVVTAFAAGTKLETVYCSEPQQNIALARNRALAHAAGDYVAFIDDDEAPEETWLLHLFKTCADRGVAGVLGPVRPRFEHEPPPWIKRGGFFNRPSHPTGYTLDWEECRTGNVLFRRSILSQDEKPFDENFGTGGEDKDFFLRMIGAGHVFVWCEEAPVYEVVPPSRCNRRYLLNRALLRGQNILKHPVGRNRRLFTSLVAVPLYSLLLPFLLLAGQEQFMKFSIKTCDHAGRLLALMRLNPVSKRES